MKRLLSTTSDAGVTLIRIVLGIVMFAHGAQKMLGWFGGAGWSGTMEAFTTQLGIPTPLAALAIIAEFLGSLGLIVGLLGRVSAFGILCNMAVAALLVHVKFGFFVNWSGTQRGEGVEYQILAIAMASLIVWKGSGAYSIDKLISEPA